MFIFSMEREINIISEKRKLFETISRGEMFGLNYSLFSME